MWGETVPVLQGHKGSCGVVRGGVADDKGAMVTDVELAVSIKINWSGPSHGLDHFKTAMNPSPNTINCYISSPNNCNNAFVRLCTCRSNLALQNEFPWRTIVERLGVQMNVMCFDHTLHTRVSFSKERP